MSQYPLLFVDSICALPLLFFKGKKCGCFFNYTFQYIAHATHKTWADPERGHGVRPLYLGQLQVTIGFLRNTGTDPLEKQLDPLGFL